MAAAFNATESVTGELGIRVPDLGRGEWHGKRQHHCEDGDQQFGFHVTTLDDISEFHSSSSWVLSAAYASLSSAMPGKFVSISCGLAMTPKTKGGHLGLRLPGCIKLAAGSRIGR